MSNSRQSTHPSGTLLTQVIYSSSCPRRDFILRVLEFNRESKSSFQCVLGIKLIMQASRVSNKLKCKILYQILLLRRSLRVALCIIQLVQILSVLFLFLDSMASLFACAIASSLSSGALLGTFRVLVTLKFFCRYTNSLD